MVGFVAQILHHGQFLGGHLGGDLLQNARARHLIRQRRDHHDAVLPFPAGPRAHTAATCLIHLQQLVTGRDDLRRGGVVRPEHMSAQVGHRRVGGCPKDGGQASVSSRRLWGGISVAMPTAMPVVPLSKTLGRRAGSTAGLFQGAVEIGRPVHRALTDLGKQHPGIGGSIGPPCSAWQRRISGRPVSPSFPCPSMIG